MGDIVALKRRKASQRHAGKTLCQSGFHRWQVVTARPFDVRRGKLVTTQRCTRCGKTRVKAT